MKVQHFGAKLQIIESLKLAHKTLAEVFNVTLDHTVSLHDAWQIGSKLDKQIENNWKLIEQLEGNNETNQ
jgi:hypothetical protein